MSLSQHLLSGSNCASACPVLSQEFTNGPRSTGLKKIKDIPPWLATYKIFPPGLIQMLLLDLLLLLLLLLLLYVFKHGGVKRPF